jgi:hypothetical protein
MSLLRRVEDFDKRKARFPIHVFRIYSSETSVCRTAELSAHRAMAISNFRVEFFETELNTATKTTSLHKIPAQLLNSRWPRTARNRSRSPLQRPGGSNHVKVLPADLFGRLV